MSEPRVLVVPGWTNSGPGHWQSLWQRAHPSWCRVEQRDWDAPQRDEWCDTLVRAVESGAGSVLLIAHSLGCIAVAHAAPRLAGRVAGALLVAPPNVERAGANQEFASFAPVPLVPLPFPSVVVASADDSYCAIGTASAYASAWGSRFADAGHEGHINTAAGRGEWPAGEALLADLLERIAG